MNTSVHDDLLQPTLAGGGPGALPIYSQQTGYITSFLGGPLAGAIVTGINARRLGRLKQDAWVVGLGVILSIGLLWWQLRLGGNELLESIAGRNGVRFAPRLAGVAYFLIALVVHRPFYRHMQLAGIDSPSGWRVGIMALVVSTIIYVAVTALLLVGR